MRAKEIILGPAVGFTYMAVIRSSVVDDPGVLLAMLVATLGAAIAIDRIQVARRRKRPVAVLVNAIMLMAVKKHARRIYLRHDGPQFSVWFENGRSQELEMTPPLKLRDAVLDEIRWRFGRWADNDILIMWFGPRWVMLRIRYTDIGGALARIDVE